MRIVNSRLLITFAGMKPGFLVCAADSAYFYLIMRHNALKTTKIYSTTNQDIA